MAKHWKADWYADGLVQKGRLVCGNVHGSSNSGCGNVGGVAGCMRGPQEVQGQEGERRWEGGSEEAIRCALEVPGQEGELLWLRQGLNGSPGSTHTNPAA